MILHQTPERWRQFLTLVSGVLLLFTLGVLLYALNKGYDITDEGYNLQLIRSNYHGITQTYFYELYQLLFGFLPTTLIWVRLVNMMVVVLANIVFIIGAFRFFSVKPTGLNTLVLLLAIPFTFIVDPLTTSYNFFAASFALIGFGSYLCSRDASLNRLWLLLSGFSIAAVAVCKITTGAWMVLFVVSLMVIFDTQRFKSLLWWFGGYLLLQVLLYFTNHQPIWLQVQQLLTYRSYFQAMDPAYGIGQMLDTTWLFLWDHLKPMVIAGGVMLFCMRSSSRTIRGLSLLLLTLGGVYWYETNAFPYTSMIAVLWCMMGVVLLAAFTPVREWYQQPEQLATGTVMIFIPFAVAFGTNNPLYYNLGYAAVCFMVIGVMGYNKIDVVYDPLKAAQLLLFTGVIAYTIYRNVVEHPYRIQPLAKHTQSITDLPALKAIRVDSVAQYQFTSLKHMMDKHGFTEASGVVMMGKFAGVLPLLGAEMPGGTIFSTPYRWLYLEGLKHDLRKFPSVYMLHDAPADHPQSIIHTAWMDSFNAVWNAHQSLQIADWEMVDATGLEPSPFGTVYLYKPVLRGDEKD